jgi:hypothetical protein
MVRPLTVVVAVAVVLVIIIFVTVPVEPFDCRALSMKLNQ